MNELVLTAFFKQKLQNTSAASLGKNQMPKTIQNALATHHFQNQPKEFKISILTINPHTTHIQLHLNIKHQCKQLELTLTLTHAMGFRSKTTQKPHSSHENKPPPSHDQDIQHSTLQNLIWNSNKTKNISIKFKLKRHGEILDTILLKFETLIRMQQFKPPTYTLILIIRRKFSNPRSFHSHSRQWTKNKGPIILKKELPNS